MLSILIGAAILGMIIAFMEEGDFPGWGSMILCVLAAIVPAGLLQIFLPPGWFIVSLAVGAVCAGFAISAVCGMSVKRASIAAAIYLAVQTALSLGLQMLAA